MFGIIMVPNAIQADDYTALPAVEDIKITRLVLYEERLDELYKRCSRLFRDAGKKLGTAKEHFSADAKFAWNISEYKFTSIEDLASLFEQKVLELTQSFMEVKGQSDRARLLVGKLSRRQSLLEIDLGSLFKPEEHEFIDCFYCIVEKGHESRFKLLFDPKSIVFLKKDGEYVLYKIYCLKRESSDLFELLSQKYTCKRIQKCSNADNIPLVDATEAIVEIDKEFGELLERIESIGLHIALLRAYTESLHRFGLPPEFKYKFVEDIKGELKKLCTSNKNLPKSRSDDLSLLTILELE